jgi:hypothetical protein
VHSEYLWLDSWPCAYTPGHAPQRAGLSHARASTSGASRRAAALSVLGKRSIGSPWVVLKHGGSTLLLRAALHAALEGVADGAKRQLIDTLERDVVARNAPPRGAALGPRPPTRSQSSSAWRSGAARARASATANERVQHLGATRCSSPTAKRARDERRAARLLHRAPRRSQAAPADKKDVVVHHEEGLLQSQHRMLGLRCIRSSC